MILLFLLFILGYAVVIYYFGKRITTAKLQKRRTKLICQHKYFGYLAVTQSYISIFFILLTLFILNKSGLFKLNTNGCLLVYIFTTVICSLAVLYKLEPTAHAQKLFEKNIKFIMLCTSSLAVIATILIVCSILVETYKFFQLIPITKFFTSLTWLPQDNIQDSTITQKFGIIPLLSGTLLITTIALLVAAPIGIFSAICLAEYLDNTVRFYTKPIIEMLAGIPTVVYGYFAAMYVGPNIRKLAEKMNFDVSSESALAAGIVMGIMIIPYIISLSDDILKSIPISIRDASIALGATKFETILQIVIPAAKSGLIGSIILAFSRAIGETMIVTMASGLTARLTVNPLQSVTTVTAQIVSILTGDQEFDSVKTLAAFALAFTLFCLTLALNMFAQRIMNQSKYVFK